MNTFYTQTLDTVPVGVILFLCVQMTAAYSAIKVQYMKSYETIIST